MKAEDINKFIKQFKDISELTEEEKDINCTYFCSDEGSEVGFAENTKFYDMGINCFIAKKYIPQKDLDDLITKSNTSQIKPTNQAKNLH